MGLDYYGVLQIQRTSTDIDIKRAYKKLALEFHPLKLKENPAGDKRVFAIICEAYDVLSDPLKRTVFDQYGEEGLKYGVPGPGPDSHCTAPYVYHGDPMRTYKDFFGTESAYANLMDFLQSPIDRGLPCKDLWKKQPPIRHPLCLTLDELYFGAIKKMKIQHLAYTNPNRSRTEIVEKILTVPIKPGLPSSTEIVFPDEGDQQPGQIPADVIFITEDRPHNDFKRDQDNNLIMIYSISLESALIGTTIVIDTIDKRTIRVPITDVVQPNYEKVIENEGMPIVDRFPQKGHLIIRFNVQFPTYIPKASKKILQAGFALSRTMAIITKPQNNINRMLLADKMQRTNNIEDVPLCSTHVINAN